MHRIGIAASKMAQGNLLKYNLFVVGISCLFSFLLFLVSGALVLVTLFFIVPAHIVKIAMAALAGLIGILGIAAVLKNVKLGKSGL